MSTQDAPIIVGIDVGTTKICTLVARVEANNKFRILGVGIEPSRGLRKGVVVDIASTSEFAFMCDADLSMPIEELNNFLPPQLEGIDISIASREAPGSIRYHEPHFRHLGGRLMNWLIQLFILPGLNDTQCGFKCFSAKATKDLFNHQTLPGWSFDIELLYIARQRGYKIQEIPIPWYFRQESKVNAVRDALQILMDIQTIRRNSNQGIYDPEN